MVLEESIRAHATSFVEALEVLCQRHNLDLTKLAVTGAAIFLALHLWAFGRDIRHAGRACEQCRNFSGPSSEKQRQKDARIERELHALREQFLVISTSLAFHIQCLVILWHVFDFCSSPAISRAVQLATGACPYCMHGVIARRLVRLTPRSLRIVASLYFLSFNCFVLGQSVEHRTNDPVAQQIFQVGSRFVMTMIFMDTAFIMPAQIITSLSECFAYWKFKGDFSLVTSFMIGQGMTCIACVAFSAAFQYTLYKYIQASLESAGAGSMVAGFRKVLRGICDGEVLLDTDFRIQGESRCLQHILMSQKSLVGKSFPDLLDEEERKGFNEFTKSSTEAASTAGDGCEEESLAARPCHRMSLRGACNIKASVDIFHVPVVDQMNEEILHLIAFREDNESKHLPEAETDIGSDWLDLLRRQQAQASLPEPVLRHAASKASETSAGYLLPACPELAELTILVDMASARLDIVQAHLRYKHINDDAGEMPCLRSLILPTDWETVRGKAERFARKIREGRVSQPKPMNGLRIKTPSDCAEG